MSDFCYLVCDSVAHLYHLEPYILQNSDKTCLVVTTFREREEAFKKQFPHLNLVFISMGEIEDIKDYLSSFPVHVFACYYSFYVSLYSKILKEKHISVYIKHGVCQKRIDLSSQLNFLGDVAILYGEKDTQLLKDTLESRRDDSIFDKLHFKISLEGESISFYKSGNQRISHYLNTGKPSKTLEDLGLDPSKKTILYLPTFDRPRHGTADSSLPFFDDLVRSMNNPREYNYIVKVHPQSFFYNQDYLKKMKELNSELSLNLVLEAFDDTLPYMEISDLAITGRTSAIYDYLYFDKPIIFLDHLGESPSNFDSDLSKGILDPYWIFQTGRIIRRENLSKSQEILQEVLMKDSFSKKRKEIKNYAFEDELTVHDIFSSIKTHKKFKSFKKLDHEALT
jgi:hypothetical protein